MPVKKRTLGCLFIDRLLLLCFNLIAKQVMNEFLTRAARQFYTVWILVFVLIIALAIGIKQRRKFESLRFLPLYASWLLFGHIIIVLGYPSRRGSVMYMIGSYVDYFFTLLELAIFSQLYYRTVNIWLFRSIIVVVNIAFLIFFCLMALADYGFPFFISEETESKVYTVEGVLLLTQCAVYFVQLFKRIPSLNLKNEPIFWVSVGLLFFLSCTLPYSILENYIDRNYPSYSYMTYSIFYIFYILLFIMIIRAYLCQVELVGEKNGSLEVPAPSPT